MPASRPAASTTTAKPSLITRFQLEERLTDGADALQRSADKGKAVDSCLWASSSVDRESGLQERKAQMIIAARRRMMEREQSVDGSRAS